MSPHRVVAPVLLALVWAAPARAAGGGEGSGWGALLWTAFNLALLLGVLVYFARKPVRTFFADRRESVKREIEEAERLRAEVEERLATWQQRLRGLDQEVARLKGLAREQAEADRERILADAHAAAERIRRDAREVVDQELRRSREELRREAAELTVKLAGELLSQQVTDADRQRLLDEFIASVEQSAEQGSQGRGH